MDIAEGITLSAGGGLDFQVNGETYADTAFQRRPYHEGNKRRSRQQKPKTLLRFIGQTVHPYDLQDK
ncbi:hypothetical protein [Bacteroides pyogenes]|uniref:hypothetical protein n=1 Tax=Bacteroides pyogenes TaxID=310300 RepID=UPI0037350100